MITIGDKYVNTANLKSMYQIDSISDTKVTVNVYINNKYHVTKNMNLKNFEFAVKNKNLIKQKIG